MYKNHPKEYDQVVEQNNWAYKPSTHTKDTDNNSHNIRKPGLPRFSPETFMEYLVRFIIADDQVSLKLSLLISYSYTS